MRFISTVRILTLVLLCVNVFPVSAKAPTTPKILFTSARDGNYEVYLMNPDGTEQVNLTQHRANDLQAVWSPTGEQILFVSNRRDLRPRGARDLYLMAPDGSNVRSVFKRKIETWRISPTWSPDGKQIAYTNVNWDAREFLIYIATLGEQEEELFMNGSDPAWSPDGTEIACSVDGRVTLVNIHTRKQERLLPKKAMFWQNHPSWSATGDKLAFAWNNNPLPPLLPGEPVPIAWANKETIYIVNRDGTELQQLVAEAGPHAWSPELSPDGAEVLYTQEIKERSQIFKVDVNSGIWTQLTHIGMPRFGNFGGDWFDPAYALPVSPQPERLTTTWGELKRE